MSFEAYVECYECGEPGGVPRAAVRRLFPVVEAEYDRNGWSILYDGVDSGRFDVGVRETDPELVESLIVHCPGDDLGLWDGLLEVLKLGNVVLYFPGDTPLLVATDGVGEHLPADMLAARGEPRVVRSGEEIRDVYRQG